MGAYPLDVMLIGGTGTGKSTTLNSIFQRRVAKVGESYDPETMIISDHRLSLVLVIIDGSNKDMGTAYKLLTSVLTPNIDSSRYNHHPACVLFRRKMVEHPETVRPHNRQHPRESQTHIAIKKPPTFSGQGFHQMEKGVFYDES
ncbi:MAG: hypothetical protein IJS39_17155 [Synergistaceae bacterium]|nr:hypothetical protein [Synergistaceae bacterium]